MEGTFTDAQKNSQDRVDSLHSFSKEKDSSVEKKLDCSRSESDKSVTKANTQVNLVLNLKQLQGSKTFLPSVHALDNRIPKHMVTIDDKYLGRCLEFIHISASKPAPCNFSLNWGWGNMELLSDSFSPSKHGAQSNSNLSRFEFDSSLAASSGTIVISPAGEWIVGSIMGSKYMTNILKSPLLQRYGAYDGVSDLEIGSSNDNKGSLGYDFLNSPGVLSDYSFSMPDRGVQSMRNNNQALKILHQRFISMSSTSSACSDHSSSASCSFTQGMLQCSWDGGKPHFIFSIDEQKMVYEAKFLSNKRADDKALDHVYAIHSRMGVKKERDIHDNDLIGVIKVSTSFTLCPNNSRIMEREFVLFGWNNNSLEGLETSSRDRGKSKGLQKKVSKVFRNKQSFKKKSTSKFGGSSSVLEECSWEPVQGAEIENDADQLGEANLLVNSSPPNVELAAITVKDHLPENRLEKVGGWGLKFLRKVQVKEMTGIMESPTTSCCCARDSGDCSTCMDVIVPAGLHGGPRTRNGGPSSLVERWRSGGCCDCGGWDLGCPLTLFSGRSKHTELSSDTDTQEQCKLTDLFIEGSEKRVPPLRMVNVHKGLYFVNFQSTLSTLQSFSIAVAFIHSHTPALRPQSVNEF